MANNSVKIGLVGFGTIGAGVARILLENAGNIAIRTAQSLELLHVVDKDVTTKRPVDLPPGMLTDDLSSVLDNPQIDVVIELVGGTTFAKDLVIKALRAGKHVVTANKALLAEHGRELYKVALECDRCIAFEASCCGGIPIVLAMRTGLAANNIKALYGIFNGTCNYILSNMTETGADFPVMLKAAQEKGYAEADPTLDINGTDSAHKLAILGSLAFDGRFDMDDIYIEGIEGISINDIQRAREMGYILKLLAIGEKADDGLVSLRVHPAFIPEQTQLAEVNGPFNAVSVFGDAVGNTLYYGRGAGMMATASAVVADVIEIALGTSQNLFKAMPMVVQQDRSANVRRIDDVDCRFYIRMQAIDQAGTFAKHAEILAKHNISLRGVMQHEGPGPDNSVPVVVITHTTQQKNMTAALAELEASDVVVGKPVCIRIVDLPEDSE